LIDNARIFLLNAAYRMTGQINGNDQLNQPFEDLADVRKIAEIFLPPGSM